MNVAKGSEATAYYTNDADDALATAHRMAEQSPTMAKQIAREIVQFRVHLLSDKFRGTEIVCADCSGHKQGTQHTNWAACADCGGNMRAVLKNWISTADVLRWLDTLESRLR